MAIPARQKNKIDKSGFSGDDLPLTSFPLVQHWRNGRVVMQGPAKPRTPVQFWVPPQEETSRIMFAPTNSVGANCFSTQPLGQATCSRAL